MTRATLPTKIEALQDFALEQYQRAEQEKQRAELFKFRLEKLTRRYFGASAERSQEPAGQQLLFALPQPEMKPTEAPAPAVETNTPAKRHGGGRKKLPPELVRHRIEYTVKEDERRCLCCGEVMQPFGAEISEQLEYYPASLFVIEHVKLKYACAGKCAEKPVTAPGPDKVVDKGLAGPGLLAWNVISKFGDHQPNYRQEEIFARHGLEIPRSTQCDWQATVAELLEPLYKRMVALTLLSSKLHTDDTPIRAQGYALRLQTRQTCAQPVLTRIRTWLDARVLDTLPKSPLGEAVAYALNQWTALRRFVENGMLEIDNNTAENALRPIALGRKNYLFLGSDEGGRRAAILYSLIRTCERHGVNAWEYLRDVLVRISTHPASAVDELLPHRWQPALVSPPAQPSLILS